MDESDSRVDENAGYYGARIGADLGTRRLLVLALLAIALTASFYALLLAVVLGVVAIIVFAVGQGSGWAMTVALPVGLLVAATRSSIAAAIPRREQFAPPGVEVSRAAQPGLWDLVDAVASKAGQRPPDSLRIAFGGSAAAMELRDGTGTLQRTVLVPFSYLIALSEAELSAVIAHELGHLAAGDTTLLRWIASVSGAINRTISRLEDLGSVLRHLFICYARGFYALTAAFSRRRELAADALSARLCGREVVVSALRSSERLASAFDVYWTVEVRPYLNAGLWPPLGSGFESFLSSPEVVEQLDELAPDRGPWRFASHPPTEQRLATILAQGGHGGPVGAAAACELLRAPDALELDLLADLGGEQARTLVPVGWQDGASRALPKVWKELLGAHPLPQQELRVSDIPEALSSSLEQAADANIPAEAGLTPWSCALALALALDGWELAKLPGHPSRLSKGGRTILPRDELQRLADGETSAESWRARCQDVGIAELLLATADVEMPQCQAAETQSPVRVAATDATPQAGFAREAPIAIALGDREVNGLIARGTLWFVLALAVPIVGVLLFAAPPPNTTEGAQVILRLIGAIIGGVVVWLIWAGHRALSHPPLLTVDEREVMLDHPRLLRQPLRIPRDAVRVIAVDDGKSSPDSDMRFSVFTDEVFSDHYARAGAARGWMWPASRGQLPLYSLGIETPNTVILLDRGIPGPRVRRERLHGPLNSELLLGLFISVKDPGAAGRALQAKGLMRAITITDLAVPPSDNEQGPTEASGVGCLVAADRNGVSAG